MLSSEGMGPTAGRWWRWGLLAAVIAVGVALRLPALDAGLSMDDYAHRAMIAGDYPAQRAWWDLFGFSHGDPAEVRTLQQAGSLPWWSHPELRIAPFRPLASATIWLDVRWLGDDPVASHVHSLGWLAAMLLAAWLLLRMTLPPAVAITALCLFALDDSHAFPVAWLANRSALMSATFGFLGVAAHVYAREHAGRSGARRYGALAPLAFLAALAAGEYGLGAFAYLAAYEALGRSDAPATRLRACLPALGVLAVWALVHRLAGAGAYGSSIYVDPIREPLVALGVLAERLPILLSNLMLALPTGELAITREGLRMQAWIGVAVLVALVGWSRRPVALKPGTVGHPRVWLVAAVLAAVPSVAAFPSARLVLVPALAADVVLARLLVTAAQRAWHGDRTFSRAGWGSLAVAIVVAHGALAPWWAQREMASIRTFARTAEAAVQTLPLPEGPVGASTRVVVLAAADPMTLLYPPLVRAAHGGARPASWWVLSGVGGPHELVREADDTIVLTPRQRPMLRGQVEQLFRRPPPGFVVGDRVALDGMTVEILGLDPEGFPTSVRVAFDRSLDDPGVLLLIATPRGYLRYPMGPVGSRVTLPPAVLPSPPPT